MERQNRIIMWLLVLLLAIIFTGLTIYFTNKKIAADKVKVETYIIYNYNYAYYYNNKVWDKITDVSFIPEEEFIIYNGYEAIGKFSAVINNYTHKITYSNEASTFSDLVGISCNKTIPFTGYDFETITVDDINYVRQFLSTKGDTYITDDTEIKLIKLDIDADALLESVYEIYYKSGTKCYNYIIIKDGDNTEVVVAYSATESDMNYKRYSINLIIDANLDEKKEILVVEDGYEYSNLLLYANQYGTYSLVE